MRKRVLTNVLFAALLGSSIGCGGGDSGARDGEDAGGPDANASGGANPGSGGSAGNASGGSGGNNTGGADAGAGGAPGGAGGTAGAPASDILPADRRVPWAPGIPGGIPVRDQICATVTDPQYGALGDGVQDDAPAIQAAIDACPEGQVVHLPAGTYRVTQTIYLLKGVVLRGDGPAATRIEGDGTPNWAILNLGEQWDEANTPITQVVSGYSKGSTSVV